MGCSNPHPHGQVWSLSAIPTLPSTELTSLARYAADPASPAAPDAPRGPNGRPCLLCEYAHFEVSLAESEVSVVVKNEHWVALVPWWATWPFELMGTYARAHLIFLSPSPPGHLPSPAHLQCQMPALRF